MEAIAVVIAALIAGPIMWLLHRLDKNNSDQHKQNLDVLNRVESKVDKVSDQLHSHIEWHLQGDDEDTNT